MENVQNDAKCIPEEWMYPSGMNIYGWSTTTVSFKLCSVYSITIYADAERVVHLLKILPVEDWYKKLFH